MKGVLRAQKKSLTHISIGGLCQSGIEGFNVRGFESLERLELSHGATGVNTRFIENLMAPRLKTFCWDFRLEDQQCTEDRSDFADAEEEWLQALLKATAEHNVSLEAVYITFSYPHESSGCFYEGHGPDGYMSCPWILLFRISQQSGVRFYYNKKLVNGWEEAKTPDMKGPYSTVVRYDSD